MMGSREQYVIDRPQEEQKAISIDKKWPFSVLQMMLSESYIRVIIGPFASGKTWGCFGDIFTRMQMSKPDNKGVRYSRGAILRNTYKELADTTIKTFLNEKLFPPEIVSMKWSPQPVAKVEFNMPDGTFVDSEILFLCCDKPEDLRKFKSMNLTWAYFNELSEFEFDHVTAVIERLGRFPEDKTLIGWIGAIADSNYCEEGSWLHEFAVENTPEGWEFFLQPGALIEGDDGKWRPNPLAENIENLFGGYDYYLRNLPGLMRKGIDRARCYYGGQWVAVVKGKPVFRESFDRVVHVRDVQKHPKLGLMIGFDFGLYPSAIICQWYGNQLKVLDEIIGDNIGVRQFLVDFLKPFLAEQYRGHKVRCIGDSTGGYRKENAARSAFDEFRDPEVQLPIEPAPSHDPNKLHEAGRWMLNGGTPRAPRVVFRRECVMLLRGLAHGYHFRRLQVSGTERYSASVEKNAFSHPVEAWLHVCAWIRQGWIVQAVDPLPMASGQTVVLDRTTGY